MLNIPLGSKIYISGPIESANGRNALNFDNAVKLLTEMGYQTISPLDNFNGMGHTRKRSENFECDYKSIVACDAIYLLKGYHRSPGCQDEIRAALNCAKPIFYEQGS
jgi:nucleoside 2-deoxyribosyltransferase